MWCIGGWSDWHAVSTSRTITSHSFGRRYATGRAGPLPPYLRRENFANLRSRIGDVDVQHRSLTDVWPRRKTGPSMLTCFWMHRTG